MKSLALGIVAVAVMTLCQGAAKADCVINVVNGQLVLTNGAVTVPPLVLSTSFAGNTLTTTLTQASPTSANLAIGPITGLTLAGLPTALANNTLNIAFASTAGTFNPNPLMLQGTVDLNTLGQNVVNFAPGTFTYTNFAANLCATFSVTVNPILVSSLLAGNVPLTANTEIRACGACAPNGSPVPEPTTMLLLGTGLAGVATRLRKRRKAA